MIAILGINTTIETAAAIITTNKAVSRVLNSRSSTVVFSFDSALVPKNMATDVTTKSIAGISMSKFMKPNSPNGHLSL